MAAVKVKVRVVVAVEAVGRGRLHPAAAAGLRNLLIGAVERGIGERRRAAHVGRTRGVTGGIRARGQLVLEKNGKTVSLPAFDVSLAQAQDGSRIAPDPLAGVGGVREPVGSQLRGQVEPDAVLQRGQTEVPELNPQRGVKFFRRAVRPDLGQVLQLLARLDRWTGDSLSPGGAG